MPRDLSLSALLDARRRSRGADPLLTYYDLASGERTELSATTFGNWVDKTANLLLDVGADPGDRVRLELARSHPGHWVTLIWWAAGWRAGIEPVLTGEAEVAVIGPADDVPDDPTVIACSLHPLGLGFATPPAGAMDYGVEVRGYADTFLGLPSPDPAPATDGDPHARLLLQPADPTEAVRNALLRPLRGTGSTVVVAGAADAERLGAIAAAERSTMSGSQDIGTSAG